MTITLEIKFNEHQFTKIMSAFTDLQAAVSNLTTVAAQAVAALGNVTAGGTPDSSIIPVTAAINAAASTLTTALGNPKPGVPAAPASLAASAIGGGVVNLTFGSVPGASGYTILRGTSAGGETVVGTTAASPASDNGLTVGTTYFYVVNATNTAGSSPNSNEVSVVAT